LLHGFPETHRSWDLQISPLVSAGYRTITPDLRGYGLSDKPRGGYDLETLAADVERLIDDLGAGPVRVVGHDWGGAITWELLQRCPQKIVNATILDCPHPALMARALRSNRRQRQRSWYMFFFQLPLLPEVWLTKDEGRNLSELFRRGSPGQECAPREIVEAETKTLIEQGGLRGPLAYYRTAFRRNLRALVSGPAERPAPIQTPLTLIWGENDSCLGLELIDGTERIARHLIVHRVANAGHFVHQERPEEVNELLLAALARTDSHS
jgi:pimeloyl-ACP methyl ester carboxylesterase